MSSDKLDRLVSRRDEILVTENRVISEAEEISTLYKSTVSKGIANELTALSVPPPEEFQSLSLGKLESSEKISHGPSMDRSIVLGVILGMFLGFLLDYSISVVITRRSEWAKPGSSAKAVSL